MKNILIIGSNGYIGSKLSQHLSNNKNYSITGIDTCWFNAKNKYTHIVDDYKNLSSSFLESYEVVILLAGHSSVKMCEGNIINSYNNNVSNFINLVGKLSKNTKFIYASSSSVYGRCTSSADENYMDFVPYNNYDITKHIIDLFIQRTEVEYYGLRFGTVNGYSPVVRNDVMINSMYHSALTNGHIKLYIKDIKRPILGIDDLSLAIETIIKSNTDNRGLYNLASFNQTAEQIAYTLSQEINIPVIEYDQNPTDVIVNTKLQTVHYDFTIDSSKFEKIYNFEFKDTIKTITNSLKNNSYIQTLRNKPFDYE